MKPGPNCANCANCANHLAYGSERHWLFCASQLGQMLVDTELESESPPVLGRSPIQRIGLTLHKMRLQKPPRSGGQGNRHWLITLTELKRWTAAYGIPLPEIFVE